MLRKLFVAIEYQDWGDAWRETDQVAAEFGLLGGTQLYEAEELGQCAVRRYPVGRSRRRAESLCNQLDDYLHRGTSLGWIVWVEPRVPRAFVRGREFLSLLGQVLRQPPGIERDYNLYLLKYDLVSLWHFLRPFARCDCGGFTKMFWRTRDPHFRNGRWVGPDDCLPF